MIFFQIKRDSGDHPGEEPDHQAQNEIRQTELRLLSRRGRVQRSRVLPPDDRADALPEDPEKAA
jgi:hypothetical protein